MTESLNISGSTDVELKRKGRKFKFNGRNLSLEIL